MSLFYASVCSLEENISLSALNLFPSKKFFFKKKNALLSFNFLKWRRFFKNFILFYLGNVNVLIGIQMIIFLDPSGYAVILQ